MNPQIPVLAGLLIFLLARSVPAQGLVVRDVPDTLGGGEGSPTNQEALVNYRRSVAERDPLDARAQAELGRALYSAGKYAEAVAAFQQALALDSNLTNAWLLLGYSHSHVKADENAVTAYRQYLLRLPDSPAGHSALAASLEQLGRYAEAEAEARRAVALDPTNSYWHVVLGTSLQLEGRDEEAVKSFERALQLDSRNILAWTGLGSAWNRLEDYAKAADAYQTATALNTNRAESFYWLGCALANAGRFDEAAGPCRRAASLNPTNAAYQRELGYTLQRLRRYDEAIISYSTTLALDPNWTNVWLDLSVCYCRAGQEEKAVTLLQRYVAAEPSRDTAWYWLARALDSVDRSEEAERALDHAVTLSPTNASYHVWLAYYRNRQGHSDGAIAAAQRALTISSNDADAYIELGVAHRHNRNYRTAVVSLQQTLSLEPTNSRALHLLGLSFDDLGQYEEANRAFEKILQSNPGDFDACNWSGLMLLQLGRFEAAAERFEQAEKIKPSQRHLTVLRFCCYVLSSHYDKAYRLFPGLLIATGTILILCYLLGSGLLLRHSFKVQTVTRPGMLFSAAWLGIFFEGQVALFIVLGPIGLAGLAQAALAAMMIAGVPVVLGAAKGFARQPWGAPFAWPLKTGSARTIVLALLGLVAMFILNGAYSALCARLTNRSMEDQLVAPFVRDATQTNPVLTIAAVAVAAPIFEEILFRGLVFGALAGRWRVRVALVVSSFLFALVHFQLIYFPPIFCLGLLLGWARWKTGSLGLPMLLHALNNAISLALLFLPQKAV